MALKHRLFSVRISEQLLEDFQNFVMKLDECIKKNTKVY
jgi:hypothetical protein